MQGESEDPAKNIPRAVRQVFWRILLFYVFAILIISLIIPYTDPSLLRNDVKDISVSPFTTGVPARGAALCGGSDERGHSDGSTVSG